MTIDKPTVQGYSFYLNVVVIGSDGRPATDETPEETPAAVTEETNAAQEEETPNETTAETTSSESTVVVDASKNNTTDPRMKLLLEGRSLVDSVFKNNPLKKQFQGSSNATTEASKKFMQEGQKMMSSIGSSLKSSGTKISQRARGFVASKTMVHRAQKAVVECIPAVTDEIGVEMSITKRFQQGPVFVLEVDMKGCDLLELLDKCLGDGVAESYRAVQAGLEALGPLRDTQEAFLRELLPKVRKDMMNRMCEIVPQKMKMKKQNEDLEIQCVALEDAEEAKWLYNFLAFMEDMK